MTITKEQETTVEMTLMDYFLDMEDFIQGKKTLNVMNVRRPKAALVKILQADLDDFKQNGFEDGGEDFAENLTQTITVLENMTDAEKEKLFADMQQQFNQKRTSIEQEMADQVTGAVKSVASKRGLSLVVDKAAVIYGGTDITKDVSDSLAKSTSASADAAKTDAAKTDSSTTK